MHLMYTVLHLRRRRASTYDNQIRDWIRKDVIKGEIRGGWGRCRVGGGDAGWVGEVHSGCRSVLGMACWRDLELREVRGTRGACDNSPPCLGPVAQGSLPPARSIAALPPHIMRAPC